MDPPMCDFLEFFLITLGVVVCVGKREPTNPLCVTLLTPTQVPSYWCWRTPTWNKLPLGVNGLMNAESL